MKFKHCLVLFFITGLLCSCTDGFVGKIKALGGSATVKCYSGTALTTFFNSGGALCRPSDCKNLVSKNINLNKEN